MNIISSFLIRKAWWVLAICGLLSLVGGFYTVQLYGNLRTDLEELLPTTSRSVRDLDEVTRRLKSIDNLAVLIFSDHPHESKRFVTDLALKLEQFPKNEVAGVEYRIDRELQFFEQRQALFMDTADLSKIRKYVSARIDYEKQIRNPLNIFAETHIPEPNLDFTAIRSKYEGQGKNFKRFPGGFFATPDQKIRALLVNVPGKTLGIDGIKHFKKRVAETIANLRPESYAPDIKIQYTGSVQEMLDEQDALVEDLAISTILVIVLVSIAMIAFFRLFWPTFALLISLLCGTLWTFGLSYFAVGYLNANSAFLGSIVLGNGINFGIILLARYLEERRRGRTCVRSCYIGMITTWRATFTAALAAGLSYGSLMLTSFRGFSQFGVIGLLGMGACWLCSYTFLPALLIAFERFRPIKQTQITKERAAPLTSVTAAVVSKYPLLVVVISTLFTVWSVYMMKGANKDLLETNLENLRSTKSLQTGAGYYTKYINDIFQRFLTPIVVLPSSRDSALEIASRLKRLKEQQGPSSNIVSVQTIDDFIPKHQDAKIALLKEIQSLIPTRLMNKLEPADQEKAKLLLNSLAYREFGMRELPTLLKEKFSEKDGSIGKLVLVEPPLTKEIWKGENLEKFIQELRTTADSVEMGAPVAGGMAITSDLVSSIARDGPKATLLAFVSALGLVILLFRKPKVCAPALFALIVGVFWFGGLIVQLAHSGLKINFLNFVALPITFGIGVDYGVNIFQRYHQQTRKNIIVVIRETGGAVGLCSLSTIIGYSSLLMASNKGFVSFGLLAVLGEITCAAAAIISLPAFLTLINKGARQ